MLLYKLAWVHEGKIVKHLLTDQTTLRSVKISLKSFKMVPCHQAHRAEISFYQTEGQICPFEKYEMSDS